MKLCKLHFAISGSMGLVLHKPSFANIYGPIYDCDIFIDKKKQSVHLSVQILWDLGWEVSIWAEEVHRPYDYGEFEGKIYFRAHKDHRQVDITYEYDERMAGNVDTDIKIVNGLPVFTEECILRQKLSRGHVKDVETIKKYLLE